MSSQWPMRLMRRVVGRAVPKIGTRAALAALTSAAAGCKLRVIIRQGVWGDNSFLALSSWVEGSSSLKKCVSVIPIT